MESTWYVYPNQTGTPKLRNRALIAKKSGWKRIQGYFNEEKEKQKEIDKDLARRKYLKDGSYEMTKNWDNSIEKIRVRFMEEHEKKLRDKEEDLVKRYLELRKEQEEERKKIINEAKRKMYMTEEKPRSLNSSLLLSEVLYERNLQLEFDKNEKDRLKNEDDKYAATVRINAEKEKEENAEKKRKQKEADLKHNEELQKQIKINSESAKQAREERLRIEILENQRSLEEAEIERQKERQKREDKKRQIRQDVEEFNAIQKKVRDEQKQIEELQDKVNRIYTIAKCRIEDTKQKRLKEAQQEKVRIRDQLAGKVMAKQADNAAVENRILENAQKEYEKRELEKLNAKKKYQEKLHKDLIETQEKYKAIKIKEEEEKEQVKKWELCNRLKTNEVLKVYDEQEKQKEIDKKIEYKQELFEQMEEIAKDLQHDKECLKQELEYYKNKDKKQHDKFFAYANEVLELAKKRGRSVEPILKVIEEYKIENELKPKKKNRTALESKVPINN